jgi:acyl transferase domain-containing protein
VGEFLAACLGGVFSLADALQIVVYRARLMQSLPAGEMLAVRTDEETVRHHLDRSGLTDRISVAAVNSPVLTVVSGPSQQIADFQASLDNLGIASAPLHTSHAFHSQMMDPAIEPFEQRLAQVPLQPSQIPLISSVTGQPLTDAVACDPGYWARHLRETVHFSAALALALTRAPGAVLEVGPGQTLSTLARQQPGLAAGTLVTAVSPHAKQQVSPLQQLWATTGALWQAGVNVSWSGVYRMELPRRAHLPGYPFERQRYWFDQLPSDPPASGELPAESASVPTAREPGSDPAAIIEPGLPDAALSVPNQGFGSDGSGKPETHRERSGGAEDEVIETIVRQQLAIMQQQLECWKSN